MVDNELDDELLKWASNDGVQFRAAAWKDELLQQDIGNLPTLKKRAQSSRWQRTLDKLSDGLVANLEQWFSDVFPQSKH